MTSANHSPQTCDYCFEIDENGVGKNSVTSNLTFVTRLKTSAQVSVFFEVSLIDFK